MGNKRVAVIGAGVVGVSTAIWLQRAGFEVVLIDREGPAAGTSYGNGGVLVPSGIMPVNSPGLLKNAPGMLMNPDSPLFLSWSYLPKMLPWLVSYIRRANVADTRKVALALTPILHNCLGEHQALAKESAAKKWVEPCDYVFVYDNQAAYQKDELAWNLRAEMGFAGTQMSAQAFAEYDPIFEDSQKIAVKFSDHGRITDPGEYVISLADHFQQSGGELVIEEVIDVVKDEKGVKGIQTRRGIIQCDEAVIAAGIWSKKLAEKQGIKVPMESERGYHIDLINPSQRPRAAMNIAAGKFVITPMQGRIRCAGIVEFGGLDAPANAAPIALLKKHLHQTLPDLKYDKVEEWMGHRPAPVDSIPFIGEIESVPGLYAAFGHHHIGLSGSARTGRLIADMIAGRELGMDIRPYQPSRFSR